MNRTVYQKQITKALVEFASSVIIAVSPFLFLLCNNSMESDSQRKLDCDHPTGLEGSNGTVVEAFDESGNCRYFHEYPGTFLQYIPWTGYDNNGQPVPSGWYTVKISVFYGKSGSVECRNIYVDNETVPPAVPQQVTAVPGNAKISVHWDMVPKAAGYIVYYSEGERLGSTPDSLRTGMVTDTVIRGLLNGHSYSISIRAINAGGASAWSDTVSSFLPVVIPLMPQQLSVYNSHKQISLSWAAVAGADTYEAYCKKGSSFSIKPGDTFEIDSAQIISTRSPPALFTGLMDCEDYIVGVLARNSAGRSPLNSIPGKPELMNPWMYWNRQVDSSVFIYWENIEGAKSYNCIIRKSISGDTGNLVFDNVLSPLEVRGLIRNQGYYATVASVDSLDKSCCMKTTSYLFTPLIPPSGFSAIPKCKRVDCSWNKSKDIKSYRVYFAKGDSVSAEDSFQTFTDTSGSIALNNGTPYTLAIASVLYYAGTDTSVSPLSESISATPMPIPPDSLVVYTSDSFAIINAKYKVNADSFYLDSLSIFYNAGMEIDTLAKPFMVSKSKLPCTIQSLSPKTWYSFAAKSHAAGFSSGLSKPYAVYTAAIKNFAIYDSVDDIWHSAVFRWDTIACAKGYIWSRYSPDVASPSWTSIFLPVETNRQVLSNNDRCRYYGCVRAVYTGGFSVYTDTLLMEPK